MWTFLWLMACSPSVEAPPVVEVPEPPTDTPPSVADDTAAAPDSDVPTNPGAARAGSTWYTTLQEAVAQAPPGAVIWVQPGVHVGPFERANDWQITIRGATGNPDDVVLQATEGQGVFNFGSDVPRSTVIRDLTVRASVSSVPGSSFGVLFDGDLRLDSVIVVGSVSSTVLTALGGRLIIEDSVFLGGAQALEVADWRPLTVEVRRTVFDGASRGTAGGNRFLEITSDRLYESLDVTFEDCEFRDAYMGDSAVVEVGGVHPVATFRRCLFTGNTFADPTHRGAALKIEPDSYLTTPSEADILIEDCVFEDNVGEMGASALWVHYAWDTRVPELMPLATITVRGTAFRRNTTAERTLRGGAIDAQWGTWLLLEDLDFGTGADANLPSDIGCWTWEGRELGEDFSADIECR